MARVVRWIGRIRAKRPRRVARVCAWCGKPMTARDAHLLARGARSTHAICGPCSQAWLEEIAHEG
jgi:hypothetical protein